MDFLISANPRVVFAFWLGVVVIAMALLMLLVILVMRQVVTRRERNRIRAATQWHQILLDSAQGMATSPPSLPRSDLPGFVDAWNHVHQSLGSHDDAGLQRVAQEIGLEQHLSVAIDHGNFHNRVMSIVALGYLRSRNQFDKLARYLDDRSTIISLSAARALMHIDPARAVTMLVPHIVERNDWPQGGVAQILHDASPSLVSKELGEVALRANADVAPRLVRFLADVSPAAAAPVIRNVLASHPDDHLISTCLQVMGDETDLDLIRSLLGHERWHVRMHAASALGRLGVREDEQRLLPLLADTQWWVRYRAAQALSRLPGIEAEDMQRVRAAQTDRFACDVLDQVIAERHMGVDQ
ncbi:HEAT repeat domain-containing protein [Lysobacter solisilvae (ex Woo and Kim 2020)]|uniref:HEAT repeat domain-containing protein n=1 Tax=Agrilutibacter terrestris TaxID=2865112 RepID=A0A7H0G0Q2_9GAMM|nr:HEAT repeat domain-containing protein [Lysobacter terrestris]QNP41868.1 HEAT repeat domain-containing protein [Lysobacter terrestris]